MRLVVPKRCLVAWVELDARGRATIGYRCPGDTGSGQYRTPGGGVSNYPRRRVKARVVRINGASVTGPARIGFELSPRSATCYRAGRELVCRVR